MNDSVQKLTWAVTDFWYSLFWPPYRPSKRAGGPARIERGSVVTAAMEIVGLQTLQGYMVSIERLGPGIVEEIDAAGQVLVHWSQANVDTWVAADEIRPIEDGGRLLTVLVCDGHGHRTLLRHKVSRLQHHWTIELRPEQVVRVEREDGSSWTFNVAPAGHGVNAPGWLYPPDDEDAEALTAAELAVA
jgi:hypothetical protein